MEENSKDNQSAALQQPARKEEGPNRRTVGEDKPDQDTTNRVAEGLTTWDGPTRERAESSTSSSSEGTQDEESDKGPPSYLSTQWAFIEKYCPEEFQQSLLDIYPDISLKNFWYEQVIPIEHCLLYTSDAADE